MTPFHDITIGDFVFIALVIWLTINLFKALKFCIWDILILSIWDVIGPSFKDARKKLNTLNDPIEKFFSKFIK